MTVARFWREQKNRYNLIGTKCDNCGRAYFPPQEICRDCHRKSIGKMETTKLRGEGKILSYTVVHEGTEAFKDQVPYVMAIIELQEGPRLTGQIVDGIGIHSPTDAQNDSKQEHNKGEDKNQKATEKEIKIGSQVKCIFRKISEDGKSGTIHYGYKFKLA